MPRRVGRLSRWTSARGAGANSTHPLVWGGHALFDYCGASAGAGRHAHAAPSRPEHDPAQGLRWRAQERGLDHLALEAEARGPLELSWVRGNTWFRRKRLAQAFAGPRGKTWKLLVDGPFTTF